MNYNKLLLFVLVLAGMWGCASKETYPLSITYRVNCNEPETIDASRLGLHDPDILADPGETIEILKVVYLFKPELQELTLIDSLQIRMTILKFQEDIQRFSWDTSDERQSAWIPARLRDVETDFGDNSDITVPGIPGTLKNYVVLENLLRITWATEELWDAVSLSLWGRTVNGETLKLDEVTMSVGPRSTSKRLKWNVRHNIFNQFILIPLFGLSADQYPELEEKEENSDTSDDWTCSHESGRIWEDKKPHALH